MSKNLDWLHTNGMLTQARHTVQHHFSQWIQQLTHLRVSDTAGIYEMLSQQTSWGLFLEILALIKACSFSGD